MQHHLESPFHAVGFALIAYVEAMLGFESDKIQIALERIAAAEALARQFSKKARRRSWYHSSQQQQQHRYTKYSAAAAETDESTWSWSSSTATTAAPCHTTLFDTPNNPIISISFEDNNTTRRKSKPPSPEIQYELLATNCMLMSSTIQFLRNSWLEYMKAAYKLRKAYKLYEHMFESLTGQKASEYASHLKKKGSSSSKKASFSAQSSSSNAESLSSMLANSAQVRASWSEKRLSLFHMSRQPSFDVSCKKRPMSTLDCLMEDSSLSVIDNAIESGIFFGIGLFSLIFSLLPPRGNNTSMNGGLAYILIIFCSQQNFEYAGISFFPPLCAPFADTIVQQPGPLFIAVSTFATRLLYQLVPVYTPTTVTQLAQLGKCTTHTGSDEAFISAR